MVILTVVDRFNKMAHFVPLPKLPSAKETAELMLWHVFCIHGFPVDVVSDCGPRFSSVFWREFCMLVGATVSLSSGFHPQSNGQSERMNQEMETALHCMVSQNPSSWSSQLLWVEYAHNTLPSVSMGSNHPCSRWRKRRSPAPQSSPSFSAATRPGAKPGLLSFVPQVDTPLQQTVGILKHPHTRWVRRCGCQLRTYLSGLSPRSWIQGSSVRLRSRR
ncbi:hypothetical protein LDENG_00037170 [Lucifuga dentata]|nr:hypothetical protein LDENG_00037170 [Lucifuga dentata]